MESSFCPLFLKKNKDLKYDKGREMKDDERKVIKNSGHKMAGALRLKILNK